MQPINGPSNNIMQPSTNQKWNEIKSILESGKPKGLWDIKMVSYWQTFPKWQSMVASVRLLLAWLSNWKKDLRLPNTTFSKSDCNLSQMELYRGQSSPSQRCIRIGSLERRGPITKKIVITELYHNFYCFIEIENQLQLVALSIYI